MQYTTTDNFLVLSAGTVSCSFWFWFRFDLTILVAAKPEIWIRNLDSAKWNLDRCNEIKGAKRAGSSFSPFSIRKYYYSDLHIFVRQSHIHIWMFYHLSIIFNSHTKLNIRLAILLPYLTRLKNHRQLWSYSCSIKRMFLGIMSEKVNSSFATLDTWTDQKSHINITADTVNYNF